MTLAKTQKEVRELASEWGAIDLATVMDDRKKWQDVAFFSDCSRYAYGRRNGSDCIVALLMCDMDCLHMRTTYYYSFDKDVIDKFLEERRFVLNSYSIY